MDPKKLAKGARPNALVAYLKKTAAGAGGAHGAHGGHASSVRMADHQGYHIMLETIYQITIDGKRLKAPLMVDDSGMVHCHSLPNYQFHSAMDMVKVIIDQFPDEFPPQGNGHGHGSAAAQARAKKKSPKTGAKRKPREKTLLKKGAPTLRGAKTKGARRNAS